MNNFSKLALAFITGAAAGVVAGIFLAPDKGVETRKKMANKAREFSDAIKTKVKEGWQCATELKDKMVKEVGGLS